MEENNNEISLMDLWNKIWKNKFLIIIITAVLVIVGTVFLYFSNKSGTVVKTDFNYRFLNASGEKYPDGTRFDYRTIFSEENLEIVKNSNNNFNTLNIEKLSKDDNAGIKWIEDKNNKDEIIRVYFEISIPVKHFDNDHDLTKEFIQALHASVINQAKDKNSNLMMHNYFKPSDDVVIKQAKYEELTYLELINLINSQISLINTSYNRFKDSYGIVQLENGKRIEDMYLEFNKWLSQDFRVNLLEDTIRNKNYYINFDRTKRLSELTYDNIENEIDMNEKIITELTKLYNELFQNGPVMGDNELASQIAAKVEENLLLAEKNKYYEAFKGFESAPVLTADAEEFKTNFFGLIDQLSLQVDNFNDYFNEYLDQNTIYTVVGDKEFVTVPKHNLILMIVVLGLLGGIIGVTTALIKESINNKENTNEIELQAEI